MSTRARLTISYALILLGTMLAFAVAIAKGQGIGAKQQLANDAFGFADQILASILRAQADGYRLTFVDSSDATKPVIKTTKEMAAALDPYPGYFMVLDKNGKLEPRKVRIGIRNRQAVQVLAGLRPGERVVGGKPEATPHPMPPASPAPSMPGAQPSSPRA